MESCWRSVVTVAKKVDGNTACVSLVLTHELGRGNLLGMCCSLQYRFLQREIERWRESERHLKVRWREFIAEFKISFRL